MFETDRLESAWDRLPPGAHCAESDYDVRALAAFMEALEQAQTLDRHSVRDRAAEQFDTERIVDELVSALQTARLGWSVQTGARI